MDSKVAKYCIILLVLSLFGRATKAVSNNHFWSVEIPSNGTAKIYLQRDYIYHITKAELNFPRSKAGVTGLYRGGSFTWAKVILHEPPVDGGWRHDTQISYLTTHNGMTSQNLDLQFKGTRDGEYLLMWRVEGENFTNETFPVVLTGYLTYDVTDIAIVRDYTNGATNECGIKTVVSLMMLVFFLAFILSEVKYVYR